uniref:GDSL esterase/lipase n=1 Tax=Oryza brachyantha TaxID=4533 RepID=J3MG40_ORYBR
MAAAALAVLVVATAVFCGAEAREAWLPPAAAKVPAVIVFGDSTVDTGNNNPPPLVPAYLDPAYGIQDFARGVCFASAGTGLDNATAGVLVHLTVARALQPWRFPALRDGTGSSQVAEGDPAVIPLWKEVEYFKEYQRRLRRQAGRAAARRVVRDALYVVSVGTNDFLENYFLLVTGRFKQFTVGEFEDFLVAQAAEFLTAIYRLGARRVAFAGLSAIGCLPLERTLNAVRGGCIEEYNQVARDYNVKVNAMMAELRSSLPGLKLAYIPVYDDMLNLINNPSTLGLENVEQGCCATGMFEMGYLCNEKSPLTCPDADKYFFWDSFHPTEKVNRFFANSTLQICLKELL